LTREIGTLRFRPGRGRSAPSGGDGRRRSAPPATSVGVRRPGHGRGRSAPPALEVGDRHPQKPWTREFGTLALEGGDRHLQPWTGEIGTSSHGRGRSAPSSRPLFLARRPFFPGVGHSLCLRDEPPSGVPSLQVAPRRRFGRAYEHVKTVPHCRHVTL